jgi:hypothetical protein
MSSTVFVNSVTLTAASWFQDVDNIAYQYLSGVAGTNTITATGPAGLGAYAAGLKFRFIPAATNTGATTINITGTAALGARNIFSAGIALTGGELTAGVPVEIADDGTRFHIISPPMTPRVLVRRKTADQSVTSQTTLQNDTDFVFPIAANEEWIADYSIDAGASILTTGLKLGITIPAGATINATADGISSAGAITISGRTAASGLVMDFTIAFWTAGGNGTFRMNAWILNGATAGSITAQFAQSTSVATATTLRKGSHMTAVRIA